MSSIQIHGKARSYPKRIAATAGSPGIGLEHTCPRDRFGGTASTVGIVAGARCGRRTADLIVRRDLYALRLRGRSASEQCSRRCRKGRL
jgi:hypothetical protein